jgi:NAD(P)-dependent dehydrogenase (short-subunit alcohol dehydrogenase family)
VSALEGKVAVVTGAGRGIGREEALFLAAEGARVVVNDMGGSWNGASNETDDRPASEVAELIRSRGGEAVANFSDVATESGAASLITQALDEFGDLDILVNNAGILRDGMLFTLDPEAWRSVVNVHIFGHYFPSRQAAIYWRSTAKGLTGDLPHRSLINTSSESGLFGTGGQTNYDMAKLGIVSFTIAVAQELRKYNVNCNAIAPRARTRLTTNSFEGSDRATEFAESASNFDPMDPANVAPFVGFLASDSAQGITAQTFVVYGGAIGKVRLPHVDSIIVNEQRWTIGELADAVADLFTELPPDHFEGPRGYDERIPMLEEE